MTKEEYEKVIRARRMQFQEEEKKLLRELFDVQDQLKKYFPEYEQLFIEAQEISNQLFDLEIKKRNLSDSQKDQYDNQQKSLSNKMRKILKYKEKLSKLIRELQEQEQILKEKLRDVEMKMRGEVYIDEPEN